MLLQPDCIPCIFTMSVSSLRKLGVAEGLLQDLIRRVAEIPALQGRQWDIPSPVVIEQVMEIIISELDRADPFAPIKEEQNRRGLELYPEWKRRVEGSGDPLYLASKLALIGNALDLMILNRVSDLGPLIRRKLKTPLPRQAFQAFRKRLEKCRHLLYLGDNAGEIVFDRLLIEVIYKQYGLETTFVVRSLPTLNDVTRREAAQVGLDRIARVVENGIRGPLPATMVSRCSPEVRRLVQEADLIISKGGGNFDSLDEEPEWKNKIAFMFLSKCLPYNRRFGTALDQPILAVPPLG